MLSATLIYFFVSRLRENERNTETKQQQEEPTSPTDTIKPLIKINPFARIKIDE